MIDCDNFVTFMVEDDADLEPAVLVAREQHARTCEDCRDFREGYRDFVAYRAAQEAGTLPLEEVNRKDPVQDVVFRAAREAISEREREERRRSPEKKRVRARVAALISATALLLGGGGQVVWQCAASAVARSTPKETGDSWVALFFGKAREQALGDVGSSSKGVLHDPH